MRSEEEAHRMIERLKEERKRSVIIYPSHTRTEIGILGKMDGIRWMLEEPLERPLVEDDETYKKEMEAHRV